jgi:hypothetical protein
MGIGMLDLVTRWVRTDKASLPPMLCPHSMIPAGEMRSCSCRQGRRAMTWDVRVAIENDWAWFELLDCRED